jgi:hypothetical protein
MTHDKIKAAARRRMAASGEPYTLARRAAISGHSEATSTSAVSPNSLSEAGRTKYLGPRRHRLVRDAVAAGAGALAFAGAVGIYGLTSTAAPARSHPTAAAPNARVMPSKAPAGRGPVRAGQVRVSEAVIPGSPILRWGLTSVTPTKTEYR